MNEPETIQAMLAAKTIAVIGLSEDPARPSHYVSAYLQQAGYRILPVNPALNGATILGEPSFSSLSALTITPDVVNVFRLPSFIPAIVDEMIALGLHKLWVQQGILNLDAAAHAESHGIHVVMDRCIMVEHRRRFAIAPPA
jgi:predicted CoA-binding protein